MQDASQTGCWNEGVQLDRIFEVTGCKTQVELASLLGIRQSSVSEVLKRGKVPPRWLIKLRRLGVNIDWVITGSGPQYIPPPFGGHLLEEAESVRRPADSAILQKILRCIPSQDLIAELERRNVPIEESLRKP